MAKYTNFPTYRLSYHNSLIINVHLGTVNNTSQARPGDHRLLDQVNDSVVIRGADCLRTRLPSDLHTFS
jgi:hypothetical protein